MCAPLNIRSFYAASGTSTSVDSVIRTIWLGRMSSEANFQHVVSRVMAAGYSIWNEPAPHSHYVKGNGEMPLIIKIKKPNGELIVSDKEYGSMQELSESMQRVYHHFYKLIK
jgi:hypothetical protein